MNCIYCGNKCAESSEKVTLGDSTFGTCCAECTKKLDNYKSNKKKNKDRFLILLIISCIISIACCFLNDILALVIPFISFGITIMIYPYTTLGFIELVGIKKSMNIARIFGLILIIIGILIYAF